jgi:predicted nucleic acid-binding protein
MKEIFSNMPHVTADELSRKGNTFLVDTCFLIHALSGHQGKLLRLMHNHSLVLTSFTLQEFDFVKHRIDEKVREAARSFFKHNTLPILDIPPHPGNRKGEENYVKTVDPHLLQDIPDPSDAVLIAAGIQTNSSILSRDRHHLYTARLENSLSHYGIAVYKDFHEVPGWTI